MPEKLPGPELRRLKAAAQKLKATFKVGKAGLSPQFVQSIDVALNHQELLKVRFDEFKEERKALAIELTARTSSHLVQQVGNVVAIYRPKREKPS